MSKQVQVLVVVDISVEAESKYGPAQIKNAVTRALERFQPLHPDGTPLGVLGFVAIPLDERGLVTRMMAKIIEADGQKPEFAKLSEPYLTAGEKLRQEATELVP